MKKIDYLKCLIGFPIGVMALMISYALVYVIDGKEKYLIELSALTDVNVLVNQIIVSGIIYVFLALGTIILCSFFKTTKENLKIKEVIIFMIGAVIFSTFINLIERLLNCGDEVKIVLEGLGILALLIWTIAYTIASVVDVYVINKN